MVEDKIRRLLDQYFEGETSIEEEQELKSYFSSGQVSEKFESYAPMFLFFQSEEQIEMGRKIDTSFATAPEPRTLGLGWYLRVAASVAVFFGVFYLNRNLPAPSAAPYAYHDTYEDPEEAYAEVRRALFYVSEKMNKGMDAASSSLEKMEPLDNILN